MWARLKARLRYWIRNGSASEELSAVDCNDLVDAAEAGNVDDRHDGLAMVVPNCGLMVGRGASFWPAVGRLGDWQSGGA